METIGYRIRSERKRLGLSQIAFAKLGGVTVQTQRKYESDARRPDADYLASVGRKADVSWIVTGERRTAAYAAGINEDEVPYGDYVSIALVDVRAAAGGGAVVESERIVDVLHFKQDWIRHELHASPQDLRLIFVDGESMEPMLHTGDVILVNVGDQAARRDGIYVLRLEDALLVKRLQRLPGQRVRVTSDNPAYQPFELQMPLEDNGAAIIGRVVWVGKRI